MCDAFHYHLDSIFVRFCRKLNKQIVGIPMGSNCAPLVADLFLFCYERDFMLSLSNNTQADVIGAFNSISRYLDDLLNIDNPYCEQKSWNIRYTMHNKFSNCFVWVSPSTSDLKFHLLP